MVLVGVATVIGAAFLWWFSQAIRALDCGAEASSECSTEGLLLVIFGWAGLVPAIATLVESLRVRGRPWRWFCATLVLYALAFIVALVLG
jgi:hypothetical protein